MHTQLKWAGIAMASGALLIVIRMAPIVAVIPDDMTFPPETSAELVRLVGIAGGRWQLAHIMGLFALTFLATGYWLHARVLLSLNHRRVGLVAGVISMFAFGFFAIAMVIDGFQVPAVAVAYTAGPGSITLDDVTAAHDLALQFFTPGIFLMFIAMAVLSSPMLHRTIPSRWLGALGQTIGIAAISAFLFGLAGPTWNNMQVGGLAMMAGFAWHLLVGISAIRARSGTGKVHRNERQLDYR